MRAHVPLFRASFLGILSLLPATLAGCGPGKGGAGGGGSSPTTSTATGGATTTTTTTTTATGGTSTGGATGGNTAGGSTTGGNTAGGSTTGGNTTGGSTTGGSTMGGTAGAGGGTGGLSGCVTAADCPSPDDVCDVNGVCIGPDLPVGTPCNTPPGLPSIACGGLFCTDGFCCDTACTAACRSCKLPGLEGTCSPLANAWDPWPEKSFLGCGTPNSCPNSCDTCGPNATCVSEDGFHCGSDANCYGGHCADGYCCNEACSGPCDVCDAQFQEGVCKHLTDGMPSAECPPSTACWGGVCKGNAGAPCAQASDCVSGACTDGVCCLDFCSPALTCKRCMPGTGLCKNIAAGQDPDDECPGAQTCNGNGACQ